MILELAIITLAHAARVAEAAVAPLSIPSSTSFYSWYGKDGNWSAVTVEVGTPPQRVQLIPSTDGTELWAVLSLGCQQGHASGSNCQQTRGGVFDESKSTSWKQLGYYDVFSDQREVTQGFNLTGLYGTDNIQLTSSISLDSHLMAGFVDDTVFTAGVFGLGPENTTFDGTTEYSSLVGSLFEKKLIPSLSWSFTAGAYYREKSVLCQVLLGGYDLDRFEPHGITFSLTPELKPLASLQRLTVKSGSDSTDMVGEAVNVYIDSTTPYLWLPNSMCEKFADKLGLHWDSSEELYFYKDAAAYSSASSANYSFVFELKNSSSVSDDVVTLNLPFAAFDLWHQFDNQSSARYFPLKRTSKSIEYTLGRSFLQETYLIVDYNRVNYTIAQAKFDGNTGSTQNIQTISDVLLELNASGTPTGLVAQTLAATKTANPPGSGGGNHKHKVAGIIAGAVVGGLVLLGLVAAAFFIVIRRRRRQRLAEELNTAAPTFPGDAAAYSAMHSPVLTSPRSPVEMAHTSPKAELAAGPVPPAYLAPQELDGMEKQELDATGANYDRGETDDSATAAAAETALAEKLAMERSPEEEAEEQAEMEMAANKALPEPDSAEVSPLSPRHHHQEEFDDMPLSPGHPQHEFDDEEEITPERGVEDDERKWLRASAEGSIKVKEQGAAPPGLRNGKATSENLLDSPFFRLSVRQ